MGKIEDLARPPPAADVQLAVAQLATPDGLRPAALRALCALVTAAFCCGGSLVAILTRGIGQKRLCGILLAAASWTVARTLRDLVVELRPKPKEDSRPEDVPAVPPAHSKEYNLV